MLNTQRHKKKGFTLLELMIAITILGVLSALISGNLINSLKKGRDAQRKGDLEQVQRALEMYYEDNKAYPSSITFGDELCHPDSCDTRNYMIKIPTDPDSDNNYLYQTDVNGTYYQLYSCIENTNDQGRGIDQDGYGTTDCGSCGICKYGISSPNTTP